MPVGNRPSVRSRAPVRPSRWASGQQARRTGTGIGRVFVAGDEEGRHGEAAKHLSSPGIHCNKAACEAPPDRMRASVGDRLVEKVERRLLSRHALACRRGKLRGVACQPAPPAAWRFHSGNVAGRPRALNHVGSSACRCEHKCAHLVLRVGEYVFDAGHTTHRLHDEAHVLGVASCSMRAARSPAKSLGSGPPGISPLGG